MKSLLIVYSYHHNNTMKVAETFSEVLDAQIFTPDQIDHEELQEYDVIGFGSGIYGAKHHGSLLNLAEKLLEVTKKSAFIFSTSAIMGKDKVAKDHLTLRKILEEKGYTIIGEFACKGFNTNSFMKYLGGMNKGRPNDEDLNNAREFAENLLTGR